MEYCLYFQQISYFIVFMVMTNPFFTIETSTTVTCHYGLECHNKYNGFNGNNYFNIHFDLV